jgi:hypothetical protein
MMEVRKGHSDPTFINALVNGEVAPRNEPARGRGAGVAVGAISER